MKTKFVKIDSKLAYDGDKTTEWTEWFCLSETWIHPYNSFGTRTQEFRDWCAAQTGKHCGKWIGVCPDVRIGGGVLNDGWGSDISNRMAGMVDFDSPDDVAARWCDEMDAALLSEVREFTIAGPDGKLDVKMTPYDAVEPDEDSLLEFGPYAGDVLKSIAAANAA